MATGLLDAYNPTAGMTLQTYQADQRQVDPTKETVQGQVNAIIAADSPLMQRARAQGMMGAASRGLLNSSLAQGAAMTSVLDKATDIGAQDANIYNQRTLANQAANNQSLAFNAGESNKLMSQGLGIAAQIGLQKDQQDFTAEQADATRAFQAAQAELDRAQQVAMADKSIEAQRALQDAQFAFNSAENALNRANQLSMQQGQFAFTAGQNAADRAQQVTMADKQIAAQQDTLKAQQAFASAQAELDRAQQTAMADKSLSSQLALQQAQQRFTAAQADLDRTQQSSMADKSLASQLTVLANQQSFQERMANLELTNKKDLLQIEANYKNQIQTNASVANAYGNLISAVGNIQTMDLDADAKKRLIDTQYGMFDDFVKLNEDITGLDIDWAGFGGNTATGTPATPAAGTTPATGTPSAPATGLINQLQSPSFEGYA